MISRDSILAIREDIPGLMASCSRLRVLNCPGKARQANLGMIRRSPERVNQYTPSSVCTCQFRHFSLGCFDGSFKAFFLGCPVRSTNGAGY